MDNEQGSQIPSAEAYRLDKEKIHHISSQGISEEYKRKGQSLIDAVAKQKGISRGKAYRSVEAVMDTIRILIMQGEEIKIGGFGTFDIVTDLKGERIPVFKAGRALKKVVNTLGKGGDKI